MPKPKGVAPKVAKVPRVAGPACHSALTLGGLGALGDLGANIAKSNGSHSFGSPGRVARNPTYPFRSLVPAEWIDGLQRMRLRTCPIAINPQRWLQLQDAATRFLELWGGQAAGLGWSALDVFGCHPEYPSDRDDYMGLIWLVTDADLQVMGPGIAMLRTRSKRLIRTSKSADVRERIPIWDLAPGGTDFSETTP